jgi:hypothetical protein
MKLIKANSNNIAICPFCNKKCKFMHSIFNTEIPVKEACAHLIGVRYQDGVFTGQFEEK